MPKYVVGFIEKSINQSDSAYSAQRYIRISTFFSMSYNSVGRCAAMVLGYYLAVVSDTSELVPEETLDTSQTMRCEDDATPKIINPVIE